MDETFYNPDDIRIDDQAFTSLQYTDEIFKAFVDAVIPRTPGLAYEFGRVQYYGALDLYTDEYMIMSLNHYYFPIADPTAAMLEIAAEQLLLSEGSEIVNLSEMSNFGELSQIDQLRAINLLQELMINVGDLPIPFQNNPGFILYITSALNRFAMMGYYSEWIGYGTTRLENPDQRKLEFYPISWEQVGYPGPSLGYRALRVHNSQ